jgi:hypothetical protein
MEGEVEAGVQVLDLLEVLVEVVVLAQLLVQETLQAHHLVKEILEEQVVHLILIIQVVEEEVHQLLVWQDYQVLLVMVEQVQHLQ